MQWSGYGFYSNVQLKTQGKTLDMNCIFTIFDDIFLEVDEHGNDMVAVFHHESDKKDAFELPLVPFKLLAHGKRGVCNLATKCSSGCDISKLDQNLVHMH